MDPLGFNLRTLHGCLKSLADPGKEVLVENNALVIRKSSRRDNSINEEAAAKILDFLFQNQDKIKGKEKTLVKKIKGRVLASNSFSASTADRVAMAFNQVGKLNSIKNKEPVGIVIEVKPAPASDSDLLSNIKLLVSNSRYTLTESLALVNPFTGSTPHAISKSGVLKALSAWPTADPELKSAIEEALLLYKPLHVVLLSIVIHNSPERDNGALMEAVSESVLSETPVLTTLFVLKQMQQNHLSDHLKNADIYLQKGGSLVLLLPKGSSMDNEGFECDNFNLLNTPIQTLPANPLDIAKEISSALADDKKNKMFRRLVFLTGHGSRNHKMIAGLGNESFKTMLSALKPKNVDFLYINSCFSGGKNMEDLSLQDGTLSCPIIVDSSADMESVGKTKSSILALKTTARLKLYPGQHYRNSPPCQLKLSDLRKIAVDAFAENPAGFDLMNMQTILLPSSDASIPHVAYAGYVPERILDVAQELKKGTGTIKDNNEARSTYFLSAPAIDATIKNEDALFPAGLASRGGDSAHVIRSLELPKVEFASITSKTIANCLNYDFEQAAFDKTPPANKLFFIGSLKCQFNGNFQEFNDVVISTSKEGLFTLCTQKSWSLSPTPYVSFVHEIEGQSVRISQNNGLLSAEQYVRSLFHALACAMPSDRQLLISAAGRQGTRETLELLNTLLWEDSPPLEALLYEAVILNRYDLFANLSENLTGSTEELNSWLRFAFLAGNERAILFFAGKGADVNQINAKGYSLLTEAVIAGNESVVLTLIQAGADPSRTDDSGKSALETAFTTPLLFKKMAEGRINNLLFSDGNPPLFHALANKAQLETVLDLGAGVDVLNTQGMSALQQMVFDQSSPEMKSLLIQRGAKLSMDGQFIQKLEYRFDQDPQGLSQAINGTDVSLDLFSEMFRSEIEEAIQIINPETLPLIKPLIKAGYSPNPESMAAQCIYLSALFMNDRELLARLAALNINPKPSMWGDIEDTALLHSISLFHPKKLTEMQREILRRYSLINPLAILEKDIQPIYPLLRNSIGLSPQEASDFFFITARSGLIHESRDWLQFSEVINEGRIIDEIIKGRSADLLGAIERRGFSINLENLKERSFDNPDLIVALLDRGITLDRAETEKVVLCAINEGSDQLQQRLRERGYHLPNRQE